MLYVNRAVVGDLLIAGGLIDRVTSCGREGMLEVIRRTFAGWRLDVEGTLPHSLEKRGVSASLYDLNYVLSLNRDVHT